MRVVDGIKVAFVSSESYFQGLHTPSMASTAKATGADMVFLLSPGVVETDLTDAEIRELIDIARECDQQ